ncbi:MAG: flagellar basal body P-ring formation chaperone FlgA [Verrucomicrobiota bacterium]|nr:flagellar basal body P-ring formation chaperone FlgA [Verrucomicrobiota bacterium]
MKAVLIFLLLMTGRGVFGETNKVEVWPLQTEVQVDSQGLHLTDLMEPGFRGVVPRLRLTNAPALGRPFFLTRAQLNQLISKTAPDLEQPRWSGAERIKVVRKWRTLAEGEMKQLVTELLQQEQVKNRGELELRFSRPWASLTIPDEPVSLRIVDMPSSGVSPSFIARIEVKAGEDLMGTWQLPLQAKIWREIWVARSGLSRGQLLQDADIALERRDVLVQRDGLAALPMNDPNIELAENLQAGAVVTVRSLKARPIVRRGKVMDALVQDGGLTISVKVEALEDALRGQTVRVRNLKSRREFRGKVQDEQTVYVNL